LDKFGRIHTIQYNKTHYNTQFRGLDICVYNSNSIFICSCINGQSIVAQRDSEKPLTHVANET